MDCRTVLKLNERYLAEGLPDNVLAEYLDHIASCESCRDNLMTDYSITKAIDQLNHNQDFSTDYSRELTQLLEKSRLYLVRKKRAARYKRAIALILMLLTVPFSVASSYATAKYYMPAGSIESLRLKYYGISSEVDPVKKAIREYNDEAITKLRQQYSDGGDNNGR